MKQLAAIIFLNFKEAVRNKFFIGVVFFFFFYLLFCILLGNLSAGHTDKVLRNTGLVGIELTSIILVMFCFNFSFYNDKNSRILEVYLSNFTRKTYISGKIIGFFLIALFYLFLAGLSSGIILTIYHAFNPQFLVALWCVFLKTAIMISFTCIFSCFFSSHIMALLTTMFLYIASEFMPTAVKLTAVSGAWGQKLVTGFLYALLPNMDKLDIKASAVYGQLPSMGYLSMATLYAFIYIVFLWLINLFIFQNKEY